MLAMVVVVALTTGMKQNCPVTVAEERSGW
jgi:hypothetical protein